MPHESTHRSFVGAGAAALTSGVASARPAIETLAISGGPKAVTVPADRQAEISKWPHYGEEEKRVILELLDSNKSYGEIPLLEKEMDRKSTRLNSSHLVISYAVFCLK